MGTKWRLYCLLKKCACGCGEYLRETEDRHRNRRKYNYRHFYRIRGSIYCGESHPQWKGGRNLTRYRKQAYVQVRVASRVRRLEHIVIYESVNKCCMLKWGVVHHIDGNGLNNEISNLAGMSKRQHQRIHLYRDPKTNRYAKRPGGN